MSRGRRWLLIVAGILVALLAAIAITLAVLLRPASLKARIEREVRAATGLVLHLDGDVQWQAWPEPKLTLGAARVEAPGTGGAATAGAAPLAQWRLLATEAHWRPLLHGERRLDSLTLDGLELTLVRGADGAIRWPELQPAAGEAGPPRALALERLEVRNGALRLVGSSASLDSLQLQTRLAYDPAAGTLELALASARAIVHGGPVPKEGVRAALAAPKLLVHLQPLSLEAQSLHAWLARAEAEVRLDGPADLATPAAAGKVHLMLPSLRAFAAALGADLPPTRDPNVFGMLELETDWHVDADQAKLDPLRIAMDGGEFRGNASMPTSGPAAGHPAHFALQGGKLDLTRYLRPKDKPGEPFTLPVQWLRAQHVEGELRLEEARLVGGVMRGVRLKVIDKAK